MNILYNTLLKSGGIKDHFRQVKVPGTGPTLIERPAVSYEQITVQFFSFFFKF
jgi:hypothetical protein